MRGLMHRFLTRSLIAGVAIVAVAGLQRRRRRRRTRRPSRRQRPPPPAITTAGGAAPVDLAAVCPDPLVIQTNWFPEGEHGGLYEMVGEGYTVDTDQQVVRGPLVAGGQDTGIDIELRAGGPAIGNQPVSVLQYTDDSIHLGHANTEGQLLRYDETPVLAVVAPMEINPQMIFWDPETYPEVETLADLGEQETTINVFEAGPSPTSSWRKASGTPTRSTPPTTAARPVSSPRTVRSPSRVSPRTSRTRTNT